MSAQKLAEVTRLAHKIMEKHGLLTAGWTFEYDRAVRRLGQCNYRTRVISLSRHWAEALPLVEVADVVLHEVAHALVPGGGHGPAWRAKAKAIGATGTRCATPSVELKLAAPWVGTCPSCSKQVEYQRAPQRVLACSLHGRWAPEYAFRWRKHGKKVPMGAKFQAEARAVLKKYGVDVLA